MIDNQDGGSPPRYSAGGGGHEGGGGGAGEHKLHTFAQNMCVSFRGHAPLYTTHFVGGGGCTFKYYTRFIGVAGGITPSPARTP